MPRLNRRRLVEAAVVTGLVMLAGCGAGIRWHEIDVTGTLPALSFTMTCAADGKTVTEANYRGKVVMLYFGYTQCPDECPTTLANLAHILARLGPAARQVRVLFVTVDPNRDTPTVLASYVRNFSPRIDGLRGTPDQLAALARRFRVVYSVAPGNAAHSYEVTHSAGIYVFDRWGAARLIIASLDSPTPDIIGSSADLERLVAETHPIGLVASLRRWL